MQPPPADLHILIDREAVAIVVLASFMAAAIALATEAVLTALVAWWRRR